ncbi:hypothetical protein ABZY03_22725 [Streptomyces klenkii]|uniref:hypothetical protein n=1 Tax=Streptomyces klenkii TaxID=1420899 RepID=UPI00339F8245
MNTFAPPHRPGPGHRGRHSLWAGAAPRPGALFDDGRDDGSQQFQLDAVRCICDDTACPCRQGAADNDCAEGCCGHTCGDQKCLCDGCGLLRLAHRAAFRESCDLPARSSVVYDFAGIDAFFAVCAPFAEPEQPGRTLYGVAVGDLGVRCFWAYSASEAAPRAPYEEIVREPGVQGFYGWDEADCRRRANRDPPSTVEN